MNPPSAALLLPAGAYLASGVFYLWRVLRRQPQAGVAALVAGIIGAACHGLILLCRLWSDPQAIAATVSSAVSLVSFLTAATFLIVQRPFRIEAIGSAVLPLCFGGAFYAAVCPPTAREVPKVLHSPWFFVHVPPALLAYVAFAFSFAVAALYLSEAQLLRSKRIAAVLGAFPPLDRLEGAMYRTASFGFLLLTIGIATGSLWAQDVYHRYWSWAPKQVASLVTWLIFATYLHYRLVRHSRGRTGAWLILIGFLCVVLTFLAGSLLPDRQHQFF